MEEVIKLFAVNSKGFDYKKFMGVEKAAPTKKTTEK
jgi:hypothetical protein